MPQPERRAYLQALTDRRNNVPHPHLEGAPFEAQKPIYYADARLLVGAAIHEWDSMAEEFGPYGMVDRRERAVRVGGLRSWNGLEASLMATVRLAIARVSTDQNACPYEAVASPSEESCQKGVKEVSMLGGMSAVTLMVNLARKMPAIARLHRAKSATETLARNSWRTLLQEPLGHPQQYAMPFMFCLGKSVGNLRRLQRNTFLPDDLIERYTTLTPAAGGEAVAWNGPTLDFTLQSPVEVMSRSHPGNARNYVAGTRLGDIETDEFTLGCPGSQLAYRMYQRTLTAIASERLWELDSTAKVP